MATLEELKNQYFADLIKSGQALISDLPQLPKETVQPISGAETQALNLAQTDIAKLGARSVVRRKVSKYSRAVKAGMAAVKASKFGGKKGKISNAKSTFATVNKVASAVNKGKKVVKTGIRGVAAKAIKGILKR